MPRGRVEAAVRAGPARAMRAALLAGDHRIEVVEVPDPGPPGPERVLVRVEASSICGSDISGYRGVNPRVRPPTILGHEIAGTVTALGAGADPALEGARVVVEPNVSCRACEWCRAGLPNVCPDYHVLGESSDYPGGLAEYVVVAADQVYRLPRHVPAAEGAVVQPLSISYHAVVRRAGVAPGEWVLVLGAGPIGLGALLLARDLGSPVIVADVVPERLEHAARLGAAAVVRADTEDVVAAVRARTGGRGVDVTVEAVGGAQQETIGVAVASTATRGRIVVVGSFSAAPQPVPVYAMKNREQVILGAHGHPDAFAPTLDLVARDRLRPADLVTHTFALPDVAAAFELLDRRANGVVKLVIDPRER